MAGTTALRTQGTGTIRRYVHDDAEEVCALHQRVFVNALPPGTTGVQFRAHMQELMEGSPWWTEELGPLVFESSSGQIHGFANVLPRRLLFRGHRVLGSVCSAMCIDRDYRGHAGVELLKRALAYPQDFILTDDANDVAAQMASHTGGTLYQLQSVRWTLPLRPASLGLSYGLNRIGVPRARWIFGGVAGLMDLAAKRFPQSPARVPADNSLSPRPIDIDAMVASLPSIRRGYRMSVDYDRESLDWIMRRARRMTQAGEPRMAMICEPDGAVVGWYTYYLRKHGLGDVVQLVAKLRYRRRVFDWMVRDAWQSGAAGLTGRLEPDTMEIIANQYCLFQPHPHWVLVNSHHAEFTRTVLSGGALLSRLEGEWAQHFPHTPASVLPAVEDLSGAHV